MDKCLSAVRYGLETLGVSSDRLFNLIESSKGYNGDDYERWLAGRIIEIAEEDGVGFSQLLVKKFSILSGLAEMDNMLIRDEYLSLFKEELGTELSKLYTIGFDNYGGFDESKKLDDFDLFTGIDYDTENTFFADRLPDDLKGKIMDGFLPFLFKFEMDAVGKKSDLFSDSKTRCVNIKYFGSLLLYRMCLLYDVFGNGNTKFAFLCPVEYLYMEDNRDIIRELLARFKVTGYDISDLNPYYGEYAFCVCRGIEDSTYDHGIILNKIKTVGGIREVSPAGLLYTHTHKKMIDYLKEGTYLEDRVPFDRNGKLSGYTHGDKKAIGYLCFGRDVFVSSYPLENFADGNCIPIVKENLLGVIGYFGMYQSNEGNGLFTDLNMFVSGHRTYLEFVYNCLPLFLFDTNSLWKGYAVKSSGSSDLKILKNKMDFLESEVVKELLDSAEVYFSFEAKELLDVGRAYYKRLGNRDRSLMSFSGVRDSVMDESLDKMYYNALSNLKKYISATYKGVC